MKRLLPYVLVLCACLALVPGTARAEDEEPLPPTSQFFDEYDANGDGKVTMAEFRGAAEVFKLLDEDGDGAITPAELGLPADYRPDPKRRGPAAGGEAPAEGRGRDRAGDRREQVRERLKAMDKDGDGRVSKAEWQGPEQLFERLDRNGDGFIDPKDRPERGAGGGRPGRGGGVPGRPGGEKGPDAAQTAERIKERTAQMFAKLDANQDGKLSGDEVPNPKLLEVADVDKDGALTLEELQKAHLERARQAAGAGRGGGKDRPRAGRGPRITAATLKRWDGDGDGKVSADEFPGREATFAHLDADGDGFLTEADLKVLEKRAKRGGGAEGSGQRPKTDRAGLIQRMDKDGDGRLNRAEFTGPDDAWRRLDRNQDGWISADEVGPVPR